MSMKVTIQLSPNTTIEASGEKQQNLFEDLGKLFEVFRPEKCGLCEQNEHFSYRARHPKSNIVYYEKICRKCGAVLTMSESAETGLYPRRKNPDDSILDNRGWAKPFKKNDKKD